MQCIIAKPISGKIGLHFRVIHPYDCTPIIIISRFFTFSVTHLFQNVLDPLLDMLYRGFQVDEAL